MAVDRKRAEDGLAELVALYREAQRVVAREVRLALMTRNMGRAQERAYALQSVITYLDSIGAETDPLAAKLIANAWGEGDASVLRKTRGTVDFTFGVVNREAMEEVQRALQGSLGDARRTVGRRVFDVYRQAGLRSTTLNLLGASGSRREASEDLVKRLTRQGIKGFTDRIGREWDLKRYAEMVSRTTTREAVVNAQIQRMAQQGIELARINHSSKPCPICQEWEGRLVSLDDSRSTLDGEEVWALSSVPGPPFHPNCFVGSTMIAGPRDHVLSRPYEGEGVVIDVTGGDKITCTPNHPILTARGWVEAGRLHEGDDLIRCTDMKAAMLRVGVDPDDKWQPAPIGKVAESLPVILPEMPVSPEDFHGDGLGSEVYVVHMDGALRDRHDAAIGKHGAQVDLISADVAGGSLDGSGSFDQLRFGAVDAAHGGMCPIHGFSNGADGNPGLGQSLVDGALRASEIASDGPGALATLVAGHDFSGVDGLHSVADAATDRTNGATGGDHQRADLSAADAESARDLRESLAGLIELSRVRSIDRVALSCHVYNTKSPTGWYAAEGIIVHNCAHYLVPESILFADKE